MTLLPDTFFHISLWNYLKRCHDQKRFSHAWIFGGPKGLGKKDFALHVAASLLENGSLREAPTTLFSEAIRRLKEKRHPDFLYLAAEDFEKGTISVDTVRTIVPFVHTHPLEGSYKIVLIDSLEALNINASNALLKSLEEPSPHVLFFLIAHHVGHVLPTILSRCQRLLFKPFPLERFEVFFGKEAGKELYILTEGAIQQARILKEQGSESVYVRFVEALSSFIEKDDMPSLMALMQEGDASQEDILFFNIIEKIITRSILFRVGYEKDLLPVEEKIAPYVTKENGERLLHLLSYLHEMRKETFLLNLDPSHVLINMLCSFKTIIKA